MKILAIGDPHGDMKTIKKIPLKNIDLILLTGDLGSAKMMRKMSFENVERKKKGLPEIEYSSKQKKKAFMEAYSSALKVVKYLSKFAPVYTIFGNADSNNTDTRKYSRKIGLNLPFLRDKLISLKRVRVINNSLANFNNFRIGGLEYFIDTNWVQDFKPSKYKKNLANARKETAKAKRILSGFSKLDVLVCHQPPYRYLDKVTAKFAPKHWQGKHAGSKAILNFIKKSQPKYVFCGHIHEGEGHVKIGKTEVYNLGVCKYKIVNL